MADIRGRAETTVLASRDCWSSKNPLVQTCIRMVDRGCCRNIGLALIFHVGLSPLRRWIAKAEADISNPTHGTNPPFALAFIWEECSSRLGGKETYLARSVRIGAGGADERR
jgi:hypothetical protein